jgi:tRNA (guanine37-N1)-methyltransferase
MKIDIVTLFPEYFKSPLNESLIKKAIDSKTLEINLINLRDFSKLKNHQVDDTPYGGGPGMVLRADVLTACLNNIKQKNSLVVLPDPAGKIFSQKAAAALAQKDHLIFICGRYEGIDQRFKDKYVDLEISLGDYVLNGGEAASLVILETVARLVPGVVGNPKSLESESFSQKTGDKLLEYPQYTRPENFEGVSVPEILLSGDHKKINEWREQRSYEKTKKIRPDLLTEKIINGL